MVKNIAVGLLVVVMLLGASFTYVEAQNVSLSQLVDLFISLGIIAPEKAAAARAAVSSSSSGSGAGQSANSGSQGSTQPSAPLISVVGNPSISKSANYYGDSSTTTISAQFNLRIDAANGDFTFLAPNETGGVTFAIHSNGLKVTPNVRSISSYSAPSGSVTAGLPAGRFKILKGNVVTLPVAFAFEDRLMNGSLVPTGAYAVAIESVGYYTGTSAAGATSLSGQTKTGTVHIEGGPAVPPVTQTTYHSADTDKDWKISESELSYFTTLYNYRSGNSRTGDYSASRICTASIPPVCGDVTYMPGTSGSRSYPTHSGDYNKNWKIDLSELTRVIAFKNSAGYKIQAGTEDGYAPIPKTRRPLACGRKGDLDNDSYIDQTDYDVLGNVVVGNTASTNEVSDLNSDGRITVSDWVLLGRYVNGLDNTFPACGSSSTDLYISDAAKADFHPYGFTVNLCVNGPKSVNDLKKENSAITSFPMNIITYDLWGREYKEDASSSGFTEDLKNGSCASIGVTLQSPQYDAYNQTKKVTFRIDPMNLIAETSEKNDYSITGSVANQSITVTSPNGGEMYKVGDTMTIRWTASNASKAAYVGIQLSYTTSNGTVYEDVIVSNAGASNAGAYSWTVSSPYGSGKMASKFKVRALLYGAPGSAPGDYSDDYFTIQSSQSAATCTDSDGGININVAGLTDGRVNGIGSYFNDSSVGANGGSCSGDSCTGVAEGYCSNGAVTNYVYQCPSGYSLNGACAAKPSASITPPTLSTSSWYSDDSSTWPIVSTPSSLNSNQAIRVKGTNGTQYFEVARGTNSGRLTSSPPAGTTQLILYVYDYAQNTYVVNDRTVNVSVTSKPTVATCTDSDGGININVAGLTDGRVNGIGSYYYDASVGSNGGQCSGESCTSVAEGYCQNGSVTNYLYACPSGYSVGGACATRTILTCSGTEPTTNSYISKGAGTYQGQSASTAWTYVSSNPNTCQYTCVNGGINNGYGCSAPNTSKPLACGSKGDMNGDGSISSADYDLLGQVVVGNISSTNERADLNGDGGISTSDWVLLGRYVNGLDTTFPACTVAPPVVTPSITVTSPNGGETLTIGSEYTIRWTAQGIQSSEYLHLMMADASGNDSHYIKPWLPAGTTEYTWRVEDAYPSMIGGNWKVSVKTSSGSVRDVSDSTFTFVGPASSAVTSSNVGNAMVGIDAVINLLRALR